MLPATIGYCSSPLLRLLDIAHLLVAPIIAPKASLLTTVEMLLLALRRMLRRCLDPLRRSSWPLLPRGASQPLVMRRLFTPTTLALALLSPAAYSSGFGFQHVVETAACEATSVGEDQVFLFEVSLQSLVSSFCHLMEIVGSPCVVLCIFAGDSQIQCS
jgi:hypothetical protein